MTKKKENFMQLSDDNSIGYDIYQQPLYSYIKEHIQSLKDFVRSEEAKGLTNLQQMRLVFYIEQLEQSCEGLFFS